MSSIWSHAQSPGLNPQHCLGQGKLTGDSCNRFGCPLLGSFPYRSFPLGTMSHSWLQGALQQVAWAGSHFLYKPPSLYHQG
jgi:hypothetical protein